jgi:predicted AAA+ superfamily ATPase
LSISKKHITFALQKRSNGSTIFAVQALVIMIIKREQYVEALLNKRWNRKVKIITGIRRCGKSFLLSTLYKDYLKSEGVPENCFIEIALDRKANRQQVFTCKR